VGELGNAGGLAGAVDADDEDDRRRLVGEVDGADVGRPGVGDAPLHEGQDFLGFLDLPLLPGVAHLVHQVQHGLGTHVAGEHRVGQLLEQVFIDLAAHREDGPQAET
jgi:hypothetical protein